MKSKVLNLEPEHVTKGRPNYQQIIDNNILSIEQYTELNETITQVNLRDKFDSEVFVRLISDGPKLVYEVVNSYSGEIDKIAPINKDNFEREIEYIEKLNKE
jgi:hypothetical protein